MNTNYAGFWIRFVALVIDSIVIGIIRSFLIVPVLAGMGIGIVHDIQNMDPEKPANFLAFLAPVLALLGIVSAISAAVWIFYYTIMESSKLQATVGKLALGVVVTDMDGAKLDFGKALIRNLCKFISSAIMMIGFIMAGFTEKSQALHDIIAGTLVVKKPSQVSKTASTN